MDSYSIGLSGIKAAQNALDIIGNNISNAATEGYHRQRIELTPAYSVQNDSTLLGGGVDYAGTTRLINKMVENELYTQQSALADVTQKFDTLSTIETIFGELSEGSNLSGSIDEFFKALNELSAHPNEIIYQTQTVSNAENMANQFRNLSQSLDSIQEQIVHQVDNTVETINTMINRIAELNGGIKKLEIQGSESHNLKDQRDQCISELSELIDVETNEMDYGVTNVSVASTSVVTGTAATMLDAGLSQEGKLAVSAEGMNFYSNIPTGGQLAGLIDLKNNIISDIQQQLNDLAISIKNQINEYHVQGLGTNGSFSQLTGWRVNDMDLDDLTSSVEDGSFYIRVTDSQTNQVTRNKINIDASVDTLTSVAGKISAITGLNATVSDFKLNITQIADKYQFDFAPALLEKPTASNLTAGSVPDISVEGVYEGSGNPVFTFEVTSASGTIGVDDLNIEVRDGEGDLVKNINVGNGYAAGDIIDIGNGIKISLSAGDLNNGDTFGIESFGNTDTSGFLAAVGLNTFFAGNDASDIELCNRISEDPTNIATALGADANDNHNASRIAAIKDSPVQALNNLTCAEFYQKLVSDIGQTTYIQRIRKENIGAAIKNLKAQQSTHSGVDVNEQAAQLLVFEQMYHAMAKYMTTVQSSLDELMQLIK